jgi:hypothetical protein
VTNFLKDVLLEQKLDQRKGKKILWEVGKMVAQGHDILRISAKSRKGGRGNGSKYG